MKLSKNGFEVEGRYLRDYRFQLADWWKQEPDEYHSPAKPKHAEGACVNPGLAEEFRELADRWYRETRKMSVADQIVMHPAYQQIIGMGKDALPFILKELEKTRGHWLWALHMICRKDHADAGQNFRQAVDSWLEWGKKQHYL